VLGASLASQARAQSADVVHASFSWNAPSECLRRDALERSVSERLGRRAFVAPSEAEIELHGDLEASESGFRVSFRLTTLDGRVVGERVLDSAAQDCAALLGPVTVILAIMLNVPRASLPLLEPEPPPPSIPWDPSIGARGGLVLGLLPSAGLEIALSFGLELRETLRFALELGYDWAPAIDAAEGELFVNAARAHLVLAVPFVAATAVRVYGVIGAGAGALFGGASGFDANRGGAAFIVEARGGARLHLRLGGITWLVLSAEAGVIPWRPTFSIGTGAAAPRETLFTPSPITARFGGGIEVAFE
jgi:hypothetical protein